MNIHSKVYKTAKIFITTATAITLIFLGICTYEVILSGKFSKILLIVFALIFIVGIDAIILTFFGRQINEISFSDGNIIFLLNNKKTVCFDCFCVKRVVKDFTRITFVCTDETGKNHSYMIDTYYPFFGKAPVDIDELKINLPMAEFFGM